MTGSGWMGKTFGVVGGGNMGEALVRGVLSSGLLPANAVSVCEPVAARREVFAELGCHIADTPDHAARRDVVLLAVKPQMMRQVVAGVAGLLRPDSLVVSIAAGVPLSALEAVLPAGVKLVRVMPNTPLLVGRGMSALARGKSVGDDDLQLVWRLFASSGAVMEVAEKDLDAVTALSGSGPAYLFYFAEALIDGGQAMGLTSDQARQLTFETLRGAAEMLCRDGQPAELRRRVTSPGGTTAAALTVMAQHDFLGMIGQALETAKARSEELGRHS